MDGTEHRARGYYQRCFWHKANGVSRSVEEDAANELEIMIRHGAGFTTSMHFEWPARRQDSHNLERMLQLMFDSGVSVQKADFRAFIAA